MRHLMVAIGVACAAGTAQAQFNTPANGTGGGTPIMPGQAVGTGFSLPNAGSQIPKAASPAGSPIGGALTKPYDPSRPLDVFKNTGIDPKTVVAPITPLGGSGNDTNLLDRLYQKLGTVTGFLKPGTPPQMNYTPGIARRNRERLEARTWRRD